LVPRSITGHEYSKSSIQYVVATNNETSFNYLPSTRLHEVHNSVSFRIQTLLHELTRPVFLDIESYDEREMPCLVPQSKCWQTSCKSISTDCRRLFPETHCVLQTRWQCRRVCQEFREGEEDIEDGCHDAYNIIVNTSRAGAKPYATILTIIVVSQDPAIEIFSATVAQRNEMSGLLIDSTVTTTKYPNFYLQSYTSQTVHRKPVHYTVLFTNRNEWKSVKDIEDLVSYNFARSNYMY
jgi:hypothetical protein